MTNNIDLSSVAPLAEMAGDSNEDTALLQRMAADAEKYLLGFAWCEAIRERYFECGVGGVVAVFLFRIAPQANVDEYLWVVVGDVPPAYLVIDGNKNPTLALRSYIDEMRKWVAAAEAGQSVHELIPVNAPATFEVAQSLKTRLDFIEAEIVPSCVERRLPT